MVGHPERDKALMTANSPALNADRIKSPLLIAQGARDPRVNKDESDQMVAALKARGIDVPYIVKDNEGHGFRNEENQFEFYDAMEKFLDKAYRQVGELRRGNCRLRRWNPCGRPNYRCDTASESMRRRGPAPPAGS